MCRKWYLLETSGGVWSEGILGICYWAMHATATTQCSRAGISAASIDAPEHISASFPWNTADTTRRRRRAAPSRPPRLAPIVPRKKIIHHTTHTNVILKIFYLRLTTPWLHKSNINCQKLSGHTRNPKETTFQTAFKMDVVQRSARACRAASARCISRCGGGGSNTTVQKMT